jgi:hypothetical protein
MSAEAPLAHVTWIVAGASSSLLPLLFWSSSPVMMKCHSVVSQAWLLNEPWFTLIVWSARAAAVGKIAHAIMRSVAAVTVMRPACVSRLPSLLRCEPGIGSYLPSSCPPGQQWKLLPLPVGDPSGPQGTTSSAEGPPIHIQRLP